jgi:hypothetical protein
MEDNIHRISARAVLKKQESPGDVAIFTIELSDEISPVRRSVWKEISVSLGQYPRWRRAKQSAVQKAWSQLSAYYDGAAVEDDEANIFRNLFADNTSTSCEQPFPASSLSRSEELSFTNELANIEQEFRHAG